MKLITVSSEFYEGHTSFDLNPAPVILVILIFISLGICCRRRSRSPILTGVTSELVSLPSVVLCWPIRVEIECRAPVLSCWVDGSYSSRMQMGHAGFLSSDGASRVQRCFPRCARQGSTESEVLAVCLAMDYARQQDYSSLIIYTDNSKVEQLLLRPKTKDQRQYPQFCALRTHYAEKSIEVIRVRGHPTREEQKHSSINREFARIDRKVRRKTRQFIRRRRRNAQAWVFFSYYYYFYYYY